MASRNGVRRLVRADSFGHLVLEVELPLFQRLLFQFLVRGDLVFRGQLTETAFTAPVLIRPMAKFRILIRKNALNVSGTIRHRYSSLKSQSASGILTLCMPGARAFQLLGKLF